MMYTGSQSSLYLSLYSLRNLLTNQRFLDTTIGDIESNLKRLLARKDIGIILINQHVSFIGFSTLDSS